MAHATVTEVRALTGWDGKTISDTNISNFIPFADRLVSRTFATKVYRERLIGNIDGQNTEFKVAHFPIADIDFDSDVDSNDVEVFFATLSDQGNLLYGSAQNVSAVEDHNGIIRVTTAPTSITADAGVFASYSYTSPHIDYASIATAASYIVAHMASYLIQGEAPDYQVTEATFLRRDVAGAPDEWMRKAIMFIYSALGNDSKGIGFRAIKANNPYSSNSPNSGVY
jgi:hypothetical protein